MTVLAVFLHVVMEWLFFVTKPSFLSVLSPSEKLVLPGSASLPLMVVALVSLVLLSLPAWVKPGVRAERFCQLLGRGVPAVILSATGLLLLDNFSYTLFGWGSSSLQDGLRVVPLLVYLALAFASYRWLAKLEIILGRNRRGRRVLFTGTWAVVLFATGAFLVQPKEALDRQGAPALRKADVQRPNILLIGGDGMNADRLSLYGYHRKTTPALDRLALESLVCENAFPNAASTGSSVVSILTSRLPTATGVIYPPDIARGESVYLHLPGLLRRLGYRTGQFSIRWYADAFDLNLQDSFDWANSRALAPTQRLLVLNRLGQTGSYFLGVLFERLADRLLFTAPRRQRPDPFREVMENRVPGHRDDQRVAEFFSFVASSQQPFFAHIHLMGTHGARFLPRRQVFSTGQEQTADWLDDFYDDAILDFDRYLEEVVAFLQHRHLLEETILVVYSDHGQQYRTLQRVPLLFRFPRGAYARRIPTLVQNLDIAPTLLEALGLEKPPWMEGQSLLRDPIDPCRQILSATLNSAFVTQKENWWFSVPKPPFFTLGAISMVAGQKGYTLDLTTRHLAVTPVAISPDDGEASCAGPDPSQALTSLKEHLRASGYDVSSLEAGTM